MDSVLDRAWAVEEFVLNVEFNHNSAPHFVAYDATKLVRQSLIPVFQLHRWLVTLF